MTRALLSVALSICLFAASAAAKEPAPKDGAIAVAAQRMQAFYEKTHDLTAHFQQTFVNPAFHKTLRSEGRLAFEKPGMIRFDYSSPEPKLFVVKGDRIVSYIPAAQQAMEGSFKADQLSASVTFLWGRGHLESEFRIAAANRKDLAPGIALELTPRHPDPRFQRIFFVVDPKSYAVKESLVVDGAGDENRFDFSDLRPDAGLSPKDFDFTPPPGTQIVQLDGQAR
jgi:outer membrane lipoprotein carrier protein